MSRAHAALRRWRRFVARGRTTAPYLSGDVFRALADVTCDRPEDVSSPAVAKGRVLFVKTDALPTFLASASEARECRVLITGNSDHEIQEIPKTLPPRLVRWFAQNTFVTSPVLAPLPIGLENAALGNNGWPSLFRPSTDAELKAKRRRAFAAFRPTTPAREGVMELLSASAVVDRADPTLSPARYQQTLRSYRFVIAPRGNGVDTHRFWEALYADTIPVTTRSAWSRAVAEMGIPMIEVDDWREVAGWSTQDLDRMSEVCPERPSALPILWAPFWRDQFSRLASA